jgi:hypothetical protein
LTGLKISGKNPIWMRHNNTEEKYRASEEQLSEEYKQIMEKAHVHNT